MTVSQNPVQVKISDTSVPVVILKLEHHLAIGIVRSLGRMGVPIYGIDPSPWSPSLHSRYCREKFIWDVDNAKPEATAEYLLNIGKKIGRRSILISTNDDTSIFLAQYAVALSQWFIYPQQSPLLARALVSKKEMYSLARKHNIPTAETVFPQSRKDLEKYLDNAVFPTMLKGIDGRLSVERSGKKMFILKSREEVIECYDKFEDQSNPVFMLQEYIPGGEDSVWMFNGYFNEQSDCLFAITGKKIRLAPVYTGYTSLGICINNDTVVDITKRFMKEIGYKGILDIGYRYDSRDGQYKVLDINPRIGATFRLFVSSNGLDVARVQYLDLTGQAVPASNIIEGRKWWVEDRDIISSLRYFKDKKLKIGEWIKSFRGVQEWAWFAWDDIIPFFVMCFGYIRNFFSRRHKP
jgi:D-aspartate ligase